MTAYTRFTNIVRSLPERSRNMIGEDEASSMDANSIATIISMSSDKEKKKRKKENTNEDGKVQIMMISIYITYLLYYSSSIIIFLLSVFPSFLLLFF